MKAYIFSFVDNFNLKSALKESVVASRRSYGFY